MSLHQDAIVVDGLIMADFGREAFQAMKDGGLSAVNCTCCLWEDFPTTMKAVAQWKAWLAEHADLILQVHTTADIRRAKAEGKVGIILGWQNTTGFGDYLPFVRLYKDLGLGVVQLTYNTANTVGSGCYETHDGGLTDFGRELVHEMNRVGILVDLSHVGGKTADDAIRWSRKPVAYSHCLPSALKAHPRNKSDEQLRFIADKGGFVGVTLFPPFLKNGPRSTLDDVLEAIEHVLNLCGERQVGIGTDFTQGHGDAFIAYANRDKGHARSLTRFGDVTMPEGMRRIEDWPNLTAAMERRGWKEERIRRVIGENWMRVLEEVWGA
ncbi:MAG: dipeptidase [Alphaproteobacteria bacterium]|nr:dipeptidase [Alphaproteobacteria bacterium]